VETWAIWLIVALALGVTELLTGTLALGLTAIAAAVTSVLAAMGLSLPIQIAAFAVATLACLVLAWPVAVRRMRRAPGLRTGVSALIGRSAVVLEEVSDHGGRVRIGGEEWSSRTYDGNMVISAGTTVDVIEISGATALVYPGGK
jgi:membrane protein implicated in regulation of membrane protease activity